MLLVQINSLILLTFDWMMCYAMVILSSVLCKTISEKVALKEHWILLQRNAQAKTAE